MMVQAIRNCSIAIELDSEYLKAYLRRAELYQETEKLGKFLNLYYFLERYLFHVKALKKYGIKLSCSIYDIKCKYF